MGSWLGHAKTAFHSSDNTVPLPLKNPTSSSNTEASTLPLRTLCEQATPPCNLNPFLPNGHLQTMWTSLESADPPVWYKRKVFEHSDLQFKGSFAVDFVVSELDWKHGSQDQKLKEQLPHRTSHYTDVEFDELGSAEDDRPMLVVLHGLAGGSDEVYLRSVLRALVYEDGNGKQEANTDLQLEEAREKRARWTACVINSRGCAMSKITSGVLYNARATWDLRETVKFIKKRWPKRPLFGLGFSLGANMLVNYLGEEGDQCPLKAAVVCSCPWNLEEGSLGLQRTWLGLEVYSRTMGTNMKKLFQSHIEEISKNPRVDPDRVLKIKYLYEFDRELQGPTWGYPSEGAYYRDASCVDTVLGVRVPLFAIHAEDDPIINMQCLPIQEIKQNPYVVLCTTSMGGHVSWYEFGGTRWFPKPISKFLNKMVDDINLDRLEKSDSLCVLPADKRGKPPAEFDPIRRKLEVIQAKL